MKEIKITLKKGKKPEIEVSGVSGGGCKDLTKKLENALGEVESDVNKSEYYCAVDNTNKNWNSGG